jgi:FkbM family methyltransferase
VRPLLRRHGLDVVPHLPFGEEAADLVALLERLRIDCVLDVGAFTGTYGRMLRELGFRGRIVSFEPASESFGALAREAAADRDWEARHAGVGSAAGTMELHLSGSAGSNSFLAANDYALAEMPRVFRQRGVETVAVTTVDAVFDDATRGATSVFLKIDTQGFDLEVIRGAATSLERIVALQVELPLRPTYEGQPGYLELLGDLAARRFEPVQLYATYRDSAGRIVECDCVLIRS